SGEWIIRFFLLVMVHLISDCTHLTQCPKLLVRITPSLTSRLDTLENIFGKHFQNTAYFAFSMKSITALETV
ncbi:hypothetical protein, partial [Vibrio cyclitrophicus]|uniref:hypothetical protein n=1 Tax=Vibrio cyclitrophicus TaxID=47951 RepID=UPI001C10EF71